MNSDAENDPIGATETPTKGGVGYCVSVIKERWNQIVTRLRNMDVQESDRFKTAFLESEPGVTIVQSIIVDGDIFAETHHHGYGAAEGYWTVYREYCTRMSKTIVTNIGLGVGFVFATIGLISTVHFIVTLIITASGFRTSSLMNPAHFDRSAKECLDSEACPWNLVFSELSDKLLLLEMAFKEQVAARENIEHAVNNQTNNNMFTTGRLSDLISQIQNLTISYEQMDKRVTSLSRRLFSDEILGFILFVIVMTEFIRQIRPYVRPFIDHVKSKIATMRHGKSHMNGVANGVTVPTENEVERPKDEIIVKKEEKKVMYQQTNSPNISMIPKLGILKNEVCVVLFKYENIPVYTNVVEAMLNQFYDVKVSAVSHPYFMVETQKDINNIPHVKLFIVICNSHGNHSNGTGRDLLAVSLKIMKRLGATIVVIIGNDEGSIKLPSHSLYNTNLHLINGLEIMQELAYNNLVFSVQHEMTSFHQTSHFRKTIKTVLNARLNSQCRNLLKND